MKTIKSSGLVASITALFFSLTFSSFTTKPGGEGFQIYLNSKLVVQHFGSELNKVGSIQLDRAALNDELTVKYHHCGQVGKNRSITIKDDHNKILKEWHFADVAKGAGEMTCKVKDIVGLKKGNGSITLNLFYSSSELPKGKQLASLVVGTGNMAKL